MYLRTVQTILGHADIETTEIYTSVSKEHVRRVLERCHPRWSPKRKQIPLFTTPDQPQRAPIKGRIICNSCTGDVAEGTTLCARHLRLARESRSRRQAEARQRKKASQGETILRNVAAAG